MHGGGGDGSAVARARSAVGYVWRRGSGGNSSGSSLKLFLLLLKEDELLLKLPLLFLQLLDWAAGLRGLVGVMGVRARMKVRLGRIRGVGRGRSVCGPPGLVR